MRKILSLLAALPFLGGCGAFADEDTIPPESVLAGEPDTFIPAPDGPFEPGEYVAKSTLIALNGEGMDNIDRRIAWGFYSGQAAAPLKFCMISELASLGMMGIVKASDSEDCAVTDGPAEAGEIKLVCPVSNGVSRSVVQRGQGEGSPDFRKTSLMPDGIGGTVELVWHFSLDRIGGCTE